MQATVFGLPRLATPSTTYCRQPRLFGTDSGSAQSQTRGCGLAPRRNDVLLRHRTILNRDTACAAAAADSANAGTIIERPKLVTDAWQKMLDLQAAGETIQSTIEEVNRGGVVIKVEGIQGFIPFSRLDPSRLAKPDAGGAADVSRDARLSLDHLRSALLGQPVKAKIIQVNVPKRKLVLSERSVYAERLAKKLKVGDVVDGVVDTITDYGVFVSIQGPDGKLRGTHGLIYKGELSWDMIMRPEQVVRVGEAVRAQVLNIDTAKVHIALTLKRMQPDPLKETLDGVLPAIEERGEALTAPTSVPQSIEEVVAELEKEDGISEIQMGRQVEEKRTVAQDLEIYISRQKVVGGYALVARAGRIVQEIFVTTDLDTAGLKAAMQSALKRLV